MKKMNRKFFSAVIVIVISLMIVGVASALSAGNVDGVWGDIDGVTAGPSTLDVIGGATTSGSTATLYPPAGDRWMERQATVCRGDADGSTTYEGWTTSGTPTWTGLGSYTGCNTATGLFFSEYVYDQLNNDNNDRWCVEIYNRTGSSVSLADYSLRFFSGGLNNFSSVALTNTTLANNDVWVVCNTAGAGQAAEDQTYTNNSDGIRAISLYNENETAGARCNRWATVPTTSLNTPAALSSGDKGVQTGSTSDENQVRYGRDAYNPSSWRSLSCDLTSFAQQSGFGFDGVNSVPTVVPNTPFYLGKFTHYNNQVYNTADGGGDSNPFVSVPLTISIPFVCNTTPPTPPVTPTYTWTPTFTLDETSNTVGTCVYPGTSVCPDKVTVTEPAGTTFTCPEGVYTVVINGFTTKNAAGGDDCSLSFSDSTSTEFITEEDADNKACLWASITAPTADIAPTKTCVLDTDGFIDNYTVVTTNVGPGAAVNPQLTDVLPLGVTYVSYTSKLYTTANPGGIPQGSCIYTSGTRTLACQLLTPLPAPGTDANARWEVVITVNQTGTAFTNTATVSSITTDPVPTNNSSTATCDPTAVTLTSFTATTVEGGIVLDWATASEYQTLGYNLYRSASLEGEKQLVNASLIPSKVAPGSLLGAVYSYTDNVPATGEYYYWLEEVEINTHATLYGPAVVIFK